jgi:hypothetical protein
MLPTHGRRSFSDTPLTTLRQTLPPPALLGHSGWLVLSEHPANLPHLDTSPPVTIATDRTPSRARRRISRGFPAVAPKPTVSKTMKGGGIPTNTIERNARRTRVVRSRASPRTWVADPVSNGVDPRSLLRCRFGQGSESTTVGRTVGDRAADFSIPDPRAGPTGRAE